MSWLKIDRKIQSHWIWKDPIKLKWWLDILLTVNYTDNKVLIGFDIVECKRGQSVLSLKSWGERWNVSKDTVRNFFKLLEKDSMIIHENISKTTRITICNYELYQSDLHEEQTQPIRKANAKQTQTHPIEEIEEYNKEKKEKESCLCFDDFWNLYDKKIGDKTKIEKKYKLISDTDRILIKEHLPKYIESQPQKQYRKNPETYLNNKSWNDEIIIKTLNKSNGNDRRDLSQIDHSTAKRLADM